MLFTHMVERNDTDQLSAILKAASEPNRRAILTLLAQNGPMKVTDIAARFDLSLNAISKHIKVLEAAGLASRRTEWREHLIEVQMGPLSQIENWFADLRSIWALRLDALEAALLEEDNND
ncbi:ArsR/SmtB family transcription factor [Shimia sagamensis]|uniref:Transcriptional regulator, ArsR family n=1 Tax=Shimia sagamensis TaxID=1566352 RepID=A0ABY1NJ33_9RHOB|nr:metalloregulator ArsR/SmtB family transcription factor [Shimia sagamensis]SMP10998.1 transcriptional regulator, ArsR family [Shimia sagamensis]